MSAMDRVRAQTDYDGPVPDPDLGYGPCWLFTGHVAPNGYGDTYDPVLKRTVLVHRVVAADSCAIALDDTATQVDHLCHDPATCQRKGRDCWHRRCVNPSHLRPVAPAANNARSSSPTAINAVKTYCPQGHEYTPENTYRSRGRRYCKACQRARRERETEKTRQRRRERDLELRRLIDEAFARQAAGGR